MPSADDVKRICEQAYSEIEDKKNTQIAFFGGSFTAIDRKYMTELLDTVSGFIGEGAFSGIRISTRPDFIDDEVLSLLREKGVTSIELGAQSMDNDVLSANERGHTAEDTIKASELIKAYGFELGLQIIPGLYKSSESIEKKTYESVLSIHPDTVRIYPIVVLEGTKLAELLKSGEYKLMPFDKMTELCAKMLKGYEANGIKVIKCGLHASDGVSGEKAGGYYHPAFREICEGLIYREVIDKKLSGRKGKFEIAVNSSAISKAIGHKKANTEYFRQKGIEIKVTGGIGIPPYECEIKG